MNNDTEKTKTSGSQNTKSLFVNLGSNFAICILCTGYIMLKICHRISFKSISFTMNDFSVIELLKQINKNNNTDKIMNDFIEKCKENRL